MKNLYNYILIFYYYDKEFYNSKNKIQLTEDLITNFNNLYNNIKIKKS